MGPNTTDPKIRHRAGGMFAEESVFFTLVDMYGNKRRLACVCNANNLILYRLSSADTPLALTYILSSDSVFDLPVKATSGWQERVIDVLENDKRVTITDIQ